MKTSDFYYELPEELIAQTPVYPRDASRLMVYMKQTDTLEHRSFHDITDYFKRGDILVINDTRVIPARLFGVKEGTERRVELLLLEKRSLTEWDVLCRPGRKLKIGSRVCFPDEKNRRLIATVLEKQEDGVTRVAFECEGVFESVLDELGETPLPPYITEKLSDKERYQTVYSRERGSAAAPTAGLHFTRELLQSLEDMGVIIVRVLLHVGLGTFRPVKSDVIEEHPMHSEYYSVSEDAAAAINAARAAGGRLFCVGTTSVRTLESVTDKEGVVHASSGYTDIFIYPGYTFKAADAIITNFHLPESTLIMLVSAFLGREKTLSLYNTAVSERYRFFSFGDGMLLM